MRLRTLLLTTTLLATSAFAAFADASTPKSVKNSPMQDFYAKVEGGLGMPTQVKSTIKTVGKPSQNEKEKFSKGFVGGIGAGYNVNEFVRTDLMIQYRNADVKKSKKSDVTSYGAMLNAYLTGHNDTIFTPYVMVGAGLGQNILKYDKVKFKKTGLIWNVGLGCQAKVHDNVSVDLGYRYVSLGNLGKKTFNKGTADETAVKFKKLASNEIVAGLVYNF
jgi:opacity protein-like surface antigen